MSSKFGLVGGQPVVTYALAVLMVLAFAVLSLQGSGEGVAGVDDALSRARSFYERNPQVEVSPRNRELLGRDFVDVIAAAHGRAGGRSTGPVFSPRMRRRTQERFEAFAGAAFEARMLAFPAWHFGVAPSGVGARAQSYLGHAFVHESLPAIAVSLLFLLVAGIGLESAWGAALFAGFCLLGTLIPAVAFRLLDASTGIPFSGASGLVAALLGAYWIRGAGGRFALPGWLLLPAWVAVEYLFVRGIWLENVGSAPWATHAVAAASGAGMAAAVRLFDVEKKLLDWADRGAETGANPVLEEAERAVEQGRPAQAFEQLQQAHAQTPEDAEVALAFWNAARNVGRGDDALGAILPILRDELRNGAGDLAIQHWRELTLATPGAEIEATLLIRVGETLLDEGHPEEALDALGQAVEHPRGLSTALAQRVVRVARDLDPALTQRAASIALHDHHLTPELRESLEALASEVSTSPPPAGSGPTPDAAQASGTGTGTGGGPAARRAPTTRETTHYPVESDIDLHNTAELTDPEEFERLTMGEAPDGRDVDPDPERVDPHTLSIQSLQQPLAGDPGPDGEAPATEPELDAMPPSASSPRVAGVVDAGATDDLVVASLVADLEVGTGLRPLKLVEGVPRAVEEAALLLEIDGRGASRIPFGRIDAVAVGAVSGLADRPVLVVDLVLNWTSLSSDPLKVIRLRSNRFDPRRLAPGAASTLDALERFLAELLRRSGATPLPDADAVAGRPFASHPDIESHQRQVLMAE